MEILLEKSEENFTSFQILKRKHKYNSCIHCAYYSAFQLSLHSLKEKFQTTFQGLCDVGVARPSEGSHEAIIKELAKILLNFNKKDSATYRNKMLDMKTIRGLADYSEICINQEHVEKVEKMLIEVREVLKK